MEYDPHAIDPDEPDQGEGAQPELDPGVEQGEPDSDGPAEPLTEPGSDDLMTGEAAQRLTEEEDPRD